MKEGGARPEGADRLRKACEGFEAIFVAQLLASGEPDDGQGILGGDVADKVFRAQFNDALATTMAKRGALGIADMLYEELKGKARGRTESESESEGTAGRPTTTTALEK